MSAEVIKVNPDAPEPALIGYAAARIKAGLLVSIPTDTFYGLAVDPINLRAVERVYEIKSRQRHKPLSLIVEGVDQAEDLAQPLDADFYALARKFWPGPLTIIVKAASQLPLKATANTGNVALRVPACEVALALVRATGSPVTATSANLSGFAECTTAENVRLQLGDQIQLIVDGGPTPRSVASTIVDLTDAEHGWRILREGAISIDAITEVLG
ncbi:MAG: threonylcarbamoyl-AMP synthase [Acidobacteriales bacterium]|nr:threonylcarbamoyl-AMP synthase [Terriglobales bacterium]